MGADEKAVVPGEETNDPNQMSFFEHIDELRGRLLKSLILWVIVFAVCFYFVKDHIFPVLAEPLIKISKSEHVFAAIDIKEPFFANIKAAFWVSIIFSSGIFFYHTWAFVAPGLTRKEKFFAIPFLIFMSFFFIAGCLFSFYFVFPYALEYLMSWNDTGFDAYTRTYYLSLLFAFVLGMGASFETPMVIFFLAKIGLVTPGFLLKHFKWAVIISFVIAAIITPTPDMIMQTALAGPMIILYLFGIGAAYFVAKKEEEEEEKELGTAYEEDDESEVD
ncbi:MAG: twin-arginine translocase subunit TatC [Acidobacteria bacterium]|nr:MAG: twin-arginine translocase subunit TatC [Acidobacteriota bacterium]